jgi:hypothetical protein
VGPPMEFHEFKTRCSRRNNDIMNGHYHYF